MLMQPFIRKKYLIELEINKGVTVFCSYQQATLQEILELEEIIEKTTTYYDILEYFLNKHWTYRNCFFGLFTRNVKITKKSLKFLIESTAENILNFIFRTYTKGYFKEIPTTKEGKEALLTKKKKKGAGIPDGTFLAFVMEHTNETFESLLNMTFEAITALNEGALWNMRARTKEGQRENERLQRMEEMRDGESIDEALTRAKELEQKIKSKKFNNPTNGRRS